MKRNKWIKVATVVISLIAIYLAFDIRRGVSHYNRGANHLAEGQYDEAIECFGKAIKVRGEFPEAHFARGTAYYEKGQYDEAIRDFDRAIELKPDFSDAYYNRGMAHYHKQRYEQAFDDMNKAQSLGHYVDADLLDTLRRLAGKGQ